VDDRSDNQWVSFVELAARRGISKDAAHRLVRRKGWRRQSDNRGRVLVLVPVEELAQAEVGRPPNQSDSPPDNRSDNAAQEAMFQVALQAKDATIAAKDGQIEALKAAGTAKDGQIQTLQGQVSMLQAETAAARKAADQAELDVDRLETERDAANTAAQEARQTAEELRQVDEARAGQGRWQRLRAAWRGQ
jgi:chromosome segregation ATPase